MKKLPALPPDYRDRLLNTREVAAGLLMKPSTVARWARQGRLPFFRMGRRMRFKWAEVEIALDKKFRASANKEAV